MTKAWPALLCLLCSCSSQVSLGTEDESAVSTMPDASVTTHEDAAAMSQDVATVSTADATMMMHPGSVDGHADEPPVDGHLGTDASPDAPDGAHYNGCAGKACGVACTVCDPHDTTCIEPPGAKMCNPHEQCVTALICP
jgi:hypothetical protein